MSQETRFRDADAGPADLRVHSVRNREAVVGPFGIALPDVLWYPDAEIAYGHRYLWMRLAEALDRNVCAEPVAPVLDCVSAKLGHCHVAGVAEGRDVRVLVLDDLPSSCSGCLNRCVVRDRGERQNCDAVLWVRLLVSS
jgi:hypothetical protein